MKKPVHVFNYGIINSAPDEVDIHIDGDIVDASTQSIMKAWFDDETSVSYKSFRNELEKVTAKKINVYINSAGGHVGDAMAIHDYLRELQGKGVVINTRGRGIIASAATFILLASDNAEMSANSWFMIHNASGAIYGDVNTIENYARTIRKFNDQIRNVYAEKTGMRREEITKLMDNETWFNAEDAKAKGFIKSITGEVAFKNKINQEDWEYANTSVLNFYNSSVKPSESHSILDEMKKYFQEFGAQITAAIKGVKVEANADSTAVVNTIADAVGKEMASLGDKIEDEVNAAVTNSLNKPENQKIISDAITNATKTLSDKIADLEKKNGELETEIQNKIGGKTTAETQETEPVIGTFS